jgi:hypothetical protein
MKKRRALSNLNKNDGVLMFSSCPQKYLFGLN